MRLGFSHRSICLLFVFAATLTAATQLWGGGTSLRFFGNGVNDIDRVKISIDNPPVPADVGATDFTIEFWMKAIAGENSAANCISGNDGWINGNIMFDRDVFGDGDFGDYGISLFGDGIAFGVHNGTSGDGICGTTNVADSQWHHIAVTRRFSDGLLRLYVDGVLEAEVDGPNGNISYRDDRPTSFPNDPFLVIGAEKHDAGPQFPSYSGWIDEVRISTNLRYTSNFTRPSTTFSLDGNTVALYHFDEGSGNVINDSDGGASNGVRNFGGSPAGPIWSPDKAPIGPLTLTFQSLITSGLTEPVALTDAGDGSGRLFITQQRGVISLWNGMTLSQFMDIQDVVQNTGNEEGLLSVAFHPDHESNGYFYVYYTNNNGDIEIARYNVMAGNPNQGDPNSGIVILTILHLGEFNHNGGQLQFGPDGYLYIGTGDGGGSGDPGENAQDINELLGKMLRIDICDGICNVTPPLYDMPPDNPYVGVDGRDEIWAIGLRNPWRHGFDRRTGDQIIADVGQNLWEEVDFQAAGSPGGVNWGWDDREGAHCYEPPVGCLTVGRTDPILEYSHSLGCSISGGYRYRGTAIPQIYGRYYYGDYCSGSVWDASQSGTGSWSSGSPLSTTYSISGFGEDQNGEMYIINLNGAVYRFTGTDSNLSLTVTDNPDPALVNTTLTYTLNVTNNGPSTANAVTVIDELPAGVTFISATHTGCTHNNGVVTCNLSNMNNGAIVQFDINVMPTAPGNISNTAIVSANENDSSASNNTDTETTQVDPLSGTDLVLTKTDSVDPVTLGNNLTYTIQITNNGPEDATGVTVTDTLPGSVTFVSASAGCSETAGVVTCNIGNLSADANASVEIDVTTTAAGTISNTASVTGNETDPIPGNNSGTEDTVVFDPNACLLCDEFDDSTLDLNWTYIKNSSFWSENGTALAGSNTKKSTAVATPVFAGCLTCYAETTMRTAGGIGNRLWLLHHYVDKKNVAELLMKEEQDKWVLKHRVNGTVVAKQKYLMTIDPNTDYTVRITYDGSTYTASLNGTALAPSLTPGGAVTPGTAALRVKATTGTFNRIEVN